VPHSGVDRAPDYRKSALLQRRSETVCETRLRGDAKFAGITETVEDFELAFDLRSIKRGCAASDIVIKVRGTAWGVLFKVPDNLIGRDTAEACGRKSFDEIEGEGKNYKRESIDVCRDGHIVPALNPAPPPLTPSAYGLLPVMFFV
jgi:hypothetical protein